MNHLFATSKPLLDVYRVSLLIGNLIRFGIVPVARLIFLRRFDAAMVGVRMRIVLERMGITYLKLGQFLATRFDLLPQAICQELDKLFEGVPPMKFEIVRKLVERELGRPLEQVFASFDRDTLGSASVAQVHRAVVLDGDVVAVKVQREYVREIFAADMRNLNRMARLVDSTGLAGTLSLKDVVGEFASFTSRELEFITEGKTADRLRQQGSEFAYIPRIRWDLTTSRLLTMEYIDGCSLAKINILLDTGDHEALEKILPGLDIPKVTHDLAYATLYQLFISGFFQADPHPGNILVRYDSTVVFVDFGIFGELSSDQLETLARYVESLTLGNIDESYRLYTRLIIPSPSSDMEAFKREAKTVLWQWHRANHDPYSLPEQRHLGRFSDQLLGLLYRHDIRLSLDTLLFWRTLIVLDATSLRPSKDFDLIATIGEFFKKYRPDPIVRFTEPAAVRELGFNALTLGREHPQQAHRIITEAAAGRIGLTVRRTKAPAGRRQEGSRTFLLALPLATVVVSVFCYTAGSNPRYFLGAFVLLVLTLFSVIGRK